MNVLAVIAAVLVGILILLGGSALVTIAGILWKKRTLAREGDQPLPNLPRNRAERRAVARRLRRSRA